MVEGSKRWTRISFKLMHPPRILVRAAPARGEGPRREAAWWRGFLTLRNCICRGHASHRPAICPPTASRVMGARRCPPNKTPSVPCGTEGIACGTTSGSPRPRGRGLGGSGVRTPCCNGQTRPRLLRRGAVRAEAPGCISPAPGSPFSGRGLSVRREAGYFSLSSRLTM